MQIPIIPFRGQKKPWNSIPRINWYHPLTFGLSLYAYDMGGVILNLVNGGRNVVVTGGTALATKTNKFGTGYLYASGGNGAAMPFSSKANGQSTFPFSFAAGFFPTAAPSGTAPVFYLGDSGAANNAFGLYMNSSATSMGYGWAGASGDQRVVASMTNGFHTAIGVAATTNTQPEYFDGKLVGTGANTSNAGLAAEQWCFNSQGFSTLASDVYTGYVFFGAFWNRALTAAEAELLHLDPYCFLIYPEDEIFSTLVGTSAVVPTNEAQYHQDWSHVGRKIIIIGTG